MQHVHFCKKCKNAVNPRSILKHRNVHGFDKAKLHLSVKNFLLKKIFKNVLEKKLFKIHP